MKESKTVRVGSFLRVNDKPYFADTYVLPADEADTVIAAGGKEIKPPSRAVTTNEANEPAKPARK